MDDQAAPDVRRALAAVTAALPAGEERPGQVEMAVAVAGAIASGEHLLVQAGTGTGKTIAYLVPAILSGRTVVVATATKALQEQLIGRDLPHLRSTIGVPFEAALLKGRSNYLCRAALADASAAGAQGALVDDGAVALDAGRLAEVVAWSVTTPTGDRSDLPLALSDPEWGRLSVGVGECPGAHRCPHGDTCFAEGARAAAAEADVVVVNTHLYGIHVATGGAVLPDHEVVVVDEAHALEDIAADTLGASVGPGRLDHLARACRTLFSADHPAIAGVESAGRHLDGVLGDLADRRVDPPALPALADALLAGAEAAGAVTTAARALDVGGDAEVRRDRVVQLATNLAVDLRLAGDPGADRVAWVEGGSSPRLRVAPVDVGGELAGRLFPHATAVLTSATLSVGGSFDPVAERLGLDRGPVDDQGDPTEPPGWRGVDVGSPFDYERQALLYCAAHLPDPRASSYEAAMLDELEGLITAAGGRTLALFTSRRAMDAAAAHLEATLDVAVLVQDRLPRPVLHEAFLEDETSVLVATMGFWQGFDAPGATCSLVTIDRLPFGRPDDPLSEARREAATRARKNAFTAVDLPRAAVLLAQGAGRLVRTATDRGVVAVLDRRLASASYRWTLVRSLPPMRRTKDPEVVRAELRGLVDRDGSPPAP
ncbi:MAG TPA: ATP-dependent DNA helicase [Acidimicrobiales bacterium]|nr:ATP-dependent DNA helicase [Acidimicrobiales bacterium]